jgi:hypothetical protein
VLITPISLTITLCADGLKFTPAPPSPRSTPMTENNRLWVLTIIIRKERSNG